ncbi:unnamed protein product [Pedinophyceae sp. YPF-701]|nr:unnamed protein product [Pedinophyceae sp. YPF-701]
MSAVIGEDVGGRVGYTVRLERKRSRDTVVEVMTTGVLLRRLRRDPTLAGVGAVIIDEAHERSIEMDVALATAVSLIRSGARSDLRLIVMSATLSDSLRERLCSVMARVPVSAASAPASDRSTPAPVVSSEGRLYPIEFRRLPAPAVGDGDLERAVAAAIAEALRVPGNGDILTFLPGESEIERTMTEFEKLDASVAKGVLLLPLHGGLDKAAQDRVMRPEGRSQRRVILATNIAESSLTIAGVRVVVDSGLKRRSVYDPDRDLHRLKTVPISQQEAAQRAGRAGRQAPGVCFRLFDDTKLAAESPEIMHGELTTLALDMLDTPAERCLGDESVWLDAPDRGRLSSAFDLLADLGACTEIPGAVGGEGGELSAVPRRWSITAAGRAMSRIAAHPRAARMLLAAQGSKDIEEVAAVLAALLTERDVLFGDGRVSADVTLRVAAVLGDDAVLEAAGVARRFVSRNGVRRVRMLARQLLSQLRTSMDRDSESSSDEGVAQLGPALSLSRPDLLGVLLAHAYPDRLATRSGSSSRATSFRMVNGETVALRGASDYLAESELLVVSSVGGNTRGRAGKTSRNLRVFMAAAVERASCMDLLAEKRRVCFWNSGQGRLTVREVVAVGDLVFASEDVDFDAHRDRDRALEAALDGSRQLGASGLKLVGPKVSLVRQVQNLAASGYGAAEGEDLPQQASELLKADFTDAALVGEASLVVKAAFDAGEAPLTVEDMLSVVSEEVVVGRIVARVLGAGADAGEVWAVLEAVCAEQSPAMSVRGAGGSEKKKPRRRGGKSGRKRRGR